MSRQHESPDVLAGGRWVTSGLIVRWEASEVAAEPVAARLCPCGEPVRGKRAKYCEDHKRARSRIDWEEAA